MSLFWAQAEAVLHSVSRVQLCHPMDCLAHQASLSLDFSGRNTEVGYHFLFRIFPAQESNPCLLSLLHQQADSLPLYQQNPFESIKIIKLKMDSISCSEMIDWLSRESVSSVRFLIFEKVATYFISSKAQMSNEGRGFMSENTTKNEVGN